MSELDLIKPIVQGGTTAGVLLAVGYFVLNKIFALLDQSRALAERQIAAFQEEARAERQAHWSEIDKLTDSIDKLVDVATEQTHQLRELREAVKR